MEQKRLEDYTFSDINDITSSEIDAIYITDKEADRYHAVVSRGIFQEIFGNDGKYEDFIKKIWFHINKGNSSADISETYEVFISGYGAIDGKYAKKVKVFNNDQPHIVQLNFYPIKGTQRCVVFLDELTDNDSIKEIDEREKEQNIQKAAFLFSMYIDVSKNTTSSISVTEISENTVDMAGPTYTDWRNMIINMFTPEDQPLFLEKSDPEYLINHLKPGKAESIDIPMRNLEGEFKWSKLTFSRVNTEDTNDCRCVFMVQDITDSHNELIETIHKYEERATIDSLTGVYNHGRIEAELNKFVTGQQNSSFPTTVVMMDIDNFKSINDTYGHDIGDKVLKKLASICLNELKPKNVSFGRWGGEEFLAVCNSLPLADVIDLFENIRIIISETAFEGVGKVTCSFGITQTRKDEFPADGFKRADKALYSAKDSGKNCVVTFS